MTPRFVSSQPSGSGRDLALSHCPRAVNGAPLGAQDGSQGRGRQRLEACAAGKRRERPGTSPCRSSGRLGVRQGRGLLMMLDNDEWAPRWH